MPSIYWVDPTNGNAPFLNVLSHAFLSQRYGVTVRSNLLKDFPPPIGVQWQNFSVVGELSTASKSKSLRYILGALYPFDWVRTVMACRLSKQRAVLITSRLALPELDSLGMSLLKMAGIHPVVLSHRPQPDYYQGASARMAARCRPFFAKAERILVMSDYNLELSMQYLNLPRDKFVKVPLPHFSEYLSGVMPDCAMENRVQRLASESDGPLLALLSQDTPEHGIETFFDALPHLREAIPNATIAVFSRIPNKNRLRAFTEALERSFAGRYLLHTSFYNYGELVALLNNVRLVVLPYKWMTQSSAAAMAAGFGIPVVATNVGGMPEMISPGRSGELFPPNDSGALAKAVARVVAEGRLEAYEHGARCWAQEVFDPAKTAIGIAQVMRDVR
ncbi:MAG: glycosyltransferase family 4 protein [Chloroflexi bacterium]|nr:glycosyltransferase family 4 protein [Chloroflexota bacterium]